MAGQDPQPGPAQPVDPEQARGEVVAPDQGRGGGATPSTPLPGGTSLRLGASGADLLAVGRLPALNLAIGVLILSAALSGSGAVALPALLVGLIWTGAAALLLVLELRDLGPQLIEVTPEQVILRHGRRPPVVLPRAELASVQLHLVTLNARLRMPRREQRLDALMLRPKQFARSHPEVSRYPALPGTDERLISLPIGRGERRWQEVDAALRASGLGSYLGVARLSVRDPGGIRDALARKPAEPEV